MTAITVPLLRSEIDSDHLPLQRCDMSTDTLLDVTAAVVVVASFLVATYWDVFRDGLNRTHDRASRSGPAAR